MKDGRSQQEDVTGLFRKFGGDAAAYKEFAPQEIPALTNPVVEPVAPPPVSPPSVSPPPIEPPPSPAAVLVSPPDAAVPRALDQLFARLNGQPAMPVPVAARGLMAHWRKPT